MILPRPPVESAIVNRVNYSRLSPPANDLELMSALFSRLKASTEREHREIEAMIAPVVSFQSMDVYKEHILKSWIFYRSIEADLTSLPWPIIGLDFDSRRKIPLLEQDLRVLGVESRPEENNQQPSESLDLDFAIGCLYVVEGATLGGQVISRLLSNSGIGPATGGRFYHGYGAKTAEMWKSFRAMAEHHCLTDIQIDRAINGAKLTFEKFSATMLHNNLAA
jgi:heme oxygenase